MPINPGNYSRAALAAMGIKEGSVTPERPIPPIAPIIQARPAKPTPIPAAKADISGDEQAPAVASAPPTPKAGGDPKRSTSAGV